MRYGFFDIQQQDPIKFKVMIIFGKGLGEQIILVHSFVVSWAHAKEQSCQLCEFQIKFEIWDCAVPAWVMKSQKSVPLSLSSKLGS